MSGSALRVELRGSPALAGLVLAVHGVSAVVLIYLLPPVAALLAVLLLAIGAAMAMREKALLFGAGSPRVLMPGREGSFAVRLRSGEEIRGSVLERRYVSRWLVVLAFASPGRRRTILVARDMLDAGAFRRLRLWALWGQFPPAATPA